MLPTDDFNDRDFGHRLRVTRIALGITEAEAALSNLLLRAMVGEGEHYLATALEHRAFGSVCPLLPGPSGLCGSARPICKNSGDTLTEDD